MILYIGASLYHILCFSIHKMIHHPEEDAVLVIGDNIFSKSGMAELKRDLDESKIFTKTVILKFIEGAYVNPVKLTEESDEAQIRQYIECNEQWVEQWLNDRKLDLSEMTEINSAIDHRHLGMYVLSKGFLYQYFEDGNGLLSREDVQLNFHKKAQYASYAVTKYLKALGGSLVVTKKYANASAQLPGFYDEKMEDFNVIRLFETLDPEKQEILLHMFHGKKLDLKEKETPVLYLTRYVRYLQNPTMENHHYISSMILDLFAGNHPVIIKPHPRDFSGQYRRWFPDAEVLEKHFPSELLPFLYDGKFHKIITVGSTAADGLKEETEEIIKLDVEFENKISSIYGYIGAICLIRHVYPEIEPDEIGAVGCVREFLDPLCRQFLGFHIPEESKKEYRVVLADDVRESLPKAEMTCFLNSAGDYRFADDMPEIFEQMSYVNLSVISKREEGSFSGKETGLLVSADQAETKKKVQDFCEKQEFPRTGLVMYMGNQNKEQKEYTKILEEILWLKCREERGREEAVFSEVPERKRNASAMDVIAIRQLCSAIRAEKGK